jgi:hypothetical protein
MIGSQPLANHKHEAFAKHCAGGKNHSEAYRATGYKGDPEKNASEIAGNPGVSERINYLKKSDEKKWRIDKEKYGRWLEDILLAEPDSAHGGSSICATSMTKAGPHTAILDKLSAAEKLAKLRGFNEPDKLAVTIDGLSEEITAVRSRK